MSNRAHKKLTLPPEQQALRNRCFHSSGTFVEFPLEDVGTSIPERFEKIVRLYPERLAVKTPERALTYAELNNVANNVAIAILARRGSEAEPVALLLRNGVAQMAAMLGILKAGKFFVLLDPSFPQLRITELFDDSLAQLLVTDRENNWLASAIARGRCQVLEFDSIACGDSSENLRRPISPDDLACLLYTSGTTGQPKGIMQTHRHLLHCMMIRTNIFRIGERDCLSLLASGTASALMITFNALLNGSVLLPFDVKREGVARLASWLTQEKISVCLISVQLFRRLCEMLTETHMFPDLRVIRLTSEAVRQTDVKLFHKHFSTHCLLVAALSSTETGPVRKYFMDHASDSLGDQVPVGYAVDSKEILLLDDGGQDVGPNKVGEIVVRSRYLSAGYWRRPDLTEAKFKGDPRGGDHRLYFTGDLGLMLPDGCLVHKGRKDFRVKIRGYGVEIGEVEKSLRCHAAIKDAVVGGHVNDSAETRLVAYFTLAAQRTLTTNELRAFLCQSLPDYMIPSAFVRLAEIPLTPSGKIDRRRLPEPEEHRPELSTSYVAPRSDAEATLARIWSEVLRLDQVGIHDNFSDLGGNSLLAVQIVSRVYDEFRIELALGLIWERPTVAALAQRIDSALQRVPSRGDPALKPARRNVGLPLSFAQQRLWFLNELEPESPAYNESRAYRLSGVLDVAALQKALDRIVARHEVLRTNFLSVDGTPTQVVANTKPVELPLIDLSAWPEFGREVEARRLLAENVRRPFDLSRDIMLRVLLLRLDEKEHILLAVNHHIAFDGWSSGVFWQELAEIYRSVVSSAPCELSKLPIQYADFAIWQRHRLRGEWIEAQLSYWKKQLDGVEPLRLFTDHGRSATLTSSGAKQSLTLAKQLSNDLKALSRQEGATLFMALLAAFQTLLHRYTGQTDIVVGTPIAGRIRLEVEKLIGFFVNTLVLRTDCSNDPTFRELLQRVRQTALDAYAHQEVPFEKLVEELQPERSLGSLPLFQVMFQLRNVPRSSFEFSGLTSSPVEVGNGTAKLDLSLSMQEEQHGLKATLEYNTDLFDDATITRMLGHLQVLLESISADPDRPISALAILTEPEKHQLLVEWNDTSTGYPKDNCIHQLFEEQVERSPDAIALVCEDRQLTYQELNKRSNQLAHYLRKLGVGPEVLVGICMERSMEMVVGMLGILKAGGAYVPLDPSYPVERLESMLADAQVSILLTEQRESRVRLGDLYSKLDFRIRQLRLDKDWQSIAKESESGPENITMADHVAYVIYTSGSTGQPKGVQITHKSLLNLVFWHHQAFSVTPGDRATLLAGPGFDAAVWELWPYLTAGASIHIPCEMTRLDAESLRDWLATQAITISFVPTALAESLIALDWPQETFLRILLTGGDTLRAYPPETLPFKLFNNYGPTECAVVAASGQAPPNPNTEHPPTIGRPIANTRIYILDASRNPAPIGVVGEVYIGGDGVARGYLNRPELAAERFVQHSFDGEPAQRLYRTGDLARYLSDGNIEFVGRADEQVKIRGYRIELGEIEAVLAQHPAVCQSVVVLRDDTVGADRLVAYVVQSQGHAVTVSELRSFLKPKLADYMIPSTFVFLASLPLTPNGKVDRKALPVPDQARPELEANFVRPRTPVEELLAEIWAEVLKVERIGIHDNFFDLGGHSLLATQAVSRLRKVFQSEIPLRHLFEFPTIAELTAALDSKARVELKNDNVAELLTEIEAMPEEEARRLLAGKSIANR